jgi:hypothetical protein
MASYREEERMEERGMRGRHGFDSDRVSGSIKGCV